MSTLKKAVKLYVIGYVAGILVLVSRKQRRKMMDSLEYESNETREVLSFALLWCIVWLIWPAILPYMISDKFKKPPVNRDVRARKSNKLEMGKSVINQPPGSIMYQPQSH